MWSREQWLQHIQVLGMLTESQLGNGMSPGVGSSGSPASPVPVVEGEDSLLPVC